MRPTAVSIAWKAIPAASALEVGVPRRAGQSRSPPAQADVPGRERHEAGDVEGEDDDDGSGEWVANADRRTDGGGRGEAPGELRGKATQRA